MVDNIQLSRLALIPNLLSIFRICLGLSVVLLYDPSSLKKLMVVFIFGLMGELSDHLDGPLARRLKVTSRTGYVLDGLADRSLYVAFILCIFATHYVSRIAVWLLVFGQIVVYALRVIDGSWHATVRSVRTLHVLHWTMLRLWVLSYILDDLAAAGSSIWRYKLDASGVLRDTFAWLAIGLLYSAVAIKATEIFRKPSE